KFPLELKEWSAFEQVIDNSIIERYDGDLEYVGESEHGDEAYYRPLDEDHVRRLLVDLWGDRLTAEAIEDAFNRLMQDRGDWPHLKELRELDELEDRLRREGLWLPDVQTD